MFSGWRPTEQPQGLKVEKNDERCPARAPSEESGVGHSALLSVSVHESYTHAVPDEGPLSQPLVFIGAGH